MSLLVISYYPIPAIANWQTDLPISIEDQLDSVSTLIEEEKYSAASDYLATISISNHPSQQVQYELLLGTISFHQGLYQDALKQLKYTLQLHGEEKNLLYAEIVNHIGNCHSRLLQLDQAETYYHKALTIRKRILGELDQLVGYSYNNLGLIEEQRGHFDKAITYYQKYLAIIEGKYDKAHQELVDPLTKIGGIYKMKMNYTLAKNYFDRALKITMATYGPDHTYTAQVYLALSELFGLAGNTKKEVSYLSKTVNIFESVYGNNHPAVKYLSHLKARNLLGMKRYGQALPILNEVKIFGEKQGYDYLVGIACEDLGQLFLEKKEYDKAEKYYQKALAYTIKQHGKQHINTFGLLINQGKKLRENDKIVAGLEKLEEARKIGETLFQDAPKNLWNLYLELGLCAVELKEWEKATAYLSNAKEAITIHQGEASYIFADLVKIDIASMKLGLAIYKTNQQTDHLLPIVNHLLPAIESKLFYLKTKFQSIGTGKSLLEQYYYFFQYAIECHYILYEHTKDQEHLEKAFAYSEKSKASILLQVLQEEEAVRVAGIPDSIVNKTNTVVADIAYKEKEIYELSDENTPLFFEKKKHLQNSLFDLQEQHEQLLDQIRADYPRYYHLKYITPPIAIADLQKNVLQNNQTLLEYFIGEEAIYIFWIHKSDFGVKRIEKKDDFEDQIEQFRNSIISYEPLGDNTALMQQYADLGWALYQQLILPVKAHLQVDVYIIANDVLEYLPFEALLSQANKDFTRTHAYRYLVNDLAITYAYSATWLYNAIKKENPAFRKTYLGIAPEFSLPSSSVLRRDLAVLKFNAVEIEKTVDILGGDVQVGMGATKAAFKEVASNYQILHLATHGKANNIEGDFSYLAFATNSDSTDNGLLYVKDLLTLHLPTELVVLSACETGIGAIQKGEGVVSVGKGCSYAGAKSILSTLWTINDNSTSKLIPDFFKELYRGVTKGRALQAAKKNFIQQNRDAHPYYWSGYLIYGDSSGMASASFLSFSLTHLTKLSCLGLACLLFFFFKKQKTPIVRQ